MNKKSIYLLLPLLFASALFFLVTPAQALPIPLTTIKGTTWLLDVTFDESKPNPITAEWTVFLKNAQGDVLTHSVEYLTCHQQGSLNIAGEFTKFSGGHIVCDMPSLIDRANKLARHNLFSAQENICDTSHVNTWVQMRGGLTETAVGVNTVFAHPSFTYRLNVSDTVKARLNIGDDIQTTSPSITVTSSLNNFLGSRIHDCHAGNCTGVHYLNNGELWREDVSLLPVDMEVLTTTVTIGSRLDASQPFHGRMMRLRSDPGCTVIPVN